MCCWITLQAVLAPFPEDGQLVRAPRGSDRVKDTARSSRQASWSTHHHPHKVPSRPALTDLCLRWVFICQTRTRLPSRTPSGSPRLNPAILCLRQPPSPREAAYKHQEEMSSFHFTCTHHGLRCTHTHTIAYTHSTYGHTLHGLEMHTHSI